MTRRLGPTRECRSCQQVKLHASRGLCNACYKRHSGTITLQKFPPLRDDVSPRARYDAWVASGLGPNDYARQVGILNTSLVRALRVERERRARLGLPWLTGWRKVRGGSDRVMSQEVRELIASVDRREAEEHPSRAG